MYFAPPSRLNDPFDARAYYTAEADIEQIDRFLKQWIGKMMPDASLQEKRRTYDDYLIGLASMSNEEHEERMNQIALEAMDQVLGVYCMTEKNDNLLMWTHYADNHSGICLQFDSEERPFKRYPQKVIYSKELPQSQFFDIKDEERTVFYTKSIDWAYEEEWRLGREHLSPGVEQFSQKALTGVIFGLRINDEDEAEVRKWVKQSKTKAKLYRAVRKKKEYGLDIVEIK